jgi:hypothetical protein
LRHGFCRPAAQHGNPRVGREGLRDADVSAARNTGAEVATGDLLIMLDDDVLADGGVACMRGLSCAFASSAPQPRSPARRHHRTNQPS